MSYKPFCQKNYNANNGVGIQTALQLLIDNGFSVKDKGDKEAFSSHDCIVSNGKDDILIEAEKSNVWFRNFDWDGREEVSVPERKHRSKSKLFIMCNKDMNACIVGLMETIKKSPVRTRYVKSSNMEEPFFYTPISQFDVYKKTDTKWISISDKNKHLNKCLSSPSSPLTMESINTQPLS
jgi:hypothetical protein